MEREKGFESGRSRASAGAYAAGLEAPGGLSHLVESAPRGASELPSAVPSFLEACGRLASAAAARGDYRRAGELIEKAARVAELGNRCAASRP